MKILIRFIPCIALALLLAAGNAAQAREGEHHPDPMTASFEKLKGKKFESMFLKHMIHHHQSAIEMAQLATSNTKRPELNKLGRDIIATQKAEIEQMKGWEKSWFGAAH